MIDVVGELISKPYIEITLNLLARFGIDVRREGWQRFTIPAGSRYRSPGDIHVEADASSASYFIALGAIAAARPAGHPHRRRRRASRSRATSASSRRRGRWARGSTAAPTGSRSRRGAWPLQGHRPRLQPHSRCRDDAGGDGAVRRRPEHAAQHRQLAREGNRPHRRHGRRVAQARRHGRGRPGLHPRASAGRRPTGAPASIRTYDDHRVAMCFSLAAFNPAARAGAHPRAALRRQDLPRLLRDPVLGRAAARRCR